jgi:acyl-CoA thioesterase
MSSRFERDTAVAPLGDGAFEARLDTGWWIIAGPNGGYLAAVVLRALDAAQGDPERTARSLTLHYTAVPAEGPVRLETRVERTGGALTSVSGRMLQDGRLIAVALAAFSRPRDSAVALSDARMPEMPPPERCARRLESPVAIHRRYDLRWGLGEGPAPGGASHAQSGGWIRLDEPCAVDACVLAAYADAFPPAVFSKFGREALTRGVPTIDLTVHFRETLPRASAGIEDYTLARFTTREGREGFIEEDGELWSADGVLLAQSRQLALAR